MKACHVPAGPRAASSCIACPGERICHHTPICPAVSRRPTNLCTSMVSIVGAIALESPPHGSSARKVEQRSTSRPDSSISARQQPTLPHNHSTPHQEFMSNPNPTSPRPTLKLKIGARRSPRETRTAPVPQSSNANKSKPGAHWSDEYKQRMQADMDALAPREAIVYI